MKVIFSDRAIESLQDAPVSVRRAFEKQLRFLVDDLLHPSLHAKKYDEANDLWQARVNKDWRFYFTNGERYYRIEKIIPHPNSSHLAVQAVCNHVDLRGGPPVFAALLS